MTDEYHFYRGPKLRMRVLESGAAWFTPETWRDRWGALLFSAFWPSRVFTVRSIDTARGIITLT